MSDQMFLSISVIGLGYIGLPTAAMFASRKVRVIGVDVNIRAVDTINRGQIHIVEPDLDMVVHAAVSQGYLRATLEPEPADAFLIAVPTPFTAEGREPDLSYVKTAAESIAPVIRKGNLVILESTSPVGATESLAEWLSSERPDLTFPQDCGAESDIRIAYCPERVLPGKIMQELIINDRIIGGMTPACSELAVRLYRKFVFGECVVASGPRVAEMCKLTENSFRDVNIAFANELSLVCDRLEIDVWELIQLANRHPRVKILQPGPGVGGHCIAVDPWFIVSSAPEETRLIRTAREVNDSKPAWVMDKIQAAVGRVMMSQSEKTASEVSIAVYGLAFKSNIDDLRESAALEVARRVRQTHAGRMLVVEPNVSCLPLGLDGAELVDAPVADADIHVMLVDHREFLELSKPGGEVVDTRGVWARN